MSCTTIQQLYAIGFFDSMDLQIARLIQRMVPETSEPAMLAAALASRAISSGHACVNLADYAGQTWDDVLARELPETLADEDGSSKSMPAPDHASGLAGLPGSVEAWQAALPARLFGNGSEEKKKRTLLVRNEGRIYLRRYWEYERKIERKLSDLHKEKTANSVDDDVLSEYFDADLTQQREAARMAIENRLSLLSGGPGTGKTYTLARAVAILGELQHKRGGNVTVRMVAPTGKAAVRMVESIKKAKTELAAELQMGGKPSKHLATIPEEATTIHRLLGPRYHSPYFKHDAANPIQADMVIVDEASMVDLPLMAKLLDALPENGSLMLVGDIDQLASVEPGRVYGDISHAAENDGPLAGVLTRLTKSWRFPDDSLIGSVSRLVNEGQGDHAWQKLQEAGTDTQLQLLDTRKLNEKNPDIIAWIREQMQRYAQTKDAASALEAAANFRILCALRNGPHGVKALNRIVEQVLSGMGLNPGRGHYDHQLIMIRVNTPSLHLYNGDVGVILPAQGEHKSFQAWFPDVESGARSVPAGLLPEHETAFAMTIHKAQGSEFPNIALVLPENATAPILTRELLYTGISRVALNPAAQTGTLQIWCTPQSFKHAVQHKTTRTSGLFKQS